MKPLPLVASLLAFAVMTTATAEPAPWYKWRSKLDGREICRQVSPGEGWDRVAGPYKDASCRRKGLPGR